VVKIEYICCSVLPISFPGVLLARKQFSSEFDQESQGLEKLMSID